MSRHYSRSVPRRSFRDRLGHPISDRSPVVRPRVSSREEQVQVRRVTRRSTHVPAAKNAKSPVAATRIDAE
ncbi:hypothetical protein PUN28_018287 [Cardiocondyla obscurior]|uniref:Uncharacterized protein n=1 Tax=Cardiocondyla obscurior TaxID=286306 RepID=A0AAW2EIV6_9HYME